MSPTLTLVTLLAATADGCAPAPLLLCAPEERAAAWRSSAAVTCRTSPTRASGSDTVTHCDSGTPVRLARPSPVPGAPAEVPPPAEAPPDAPPAASAIITTPIASVRVKQKREAQDDVAYFSSFTSMADALSYAKEQLVPREQSEGAKWRIIKRADGREDKSRDKQWRCYRSTAIAIGALIANGMTYQEGLDVVEARFKTFGIQPHTPFLRAINEEIKTQMQTRQADQIARSVLGCI